MVKICGDTLKDCVIYNNKNGNEDAKTELIMAFVLPKFKKTLHLNLRKGAVIAFIAPYFLSSSTQTGKKITG